MEIKLNWEKPFDAQVKVHLAKENTDVVATLTEEQISTIQYYSKICYTAQLIMDDYPVTEDKAMSLAKEVHKTMNKYGLSEEEAIEEICEGE